MGPYGSNKSKHGSGPTLQLKTSYNYGLIKGLFGRRIYTVPYIILCIGGYARQQSLACECPSTVRHGKRHGIP